MDLFGPGVSVRRGRDVRMSPAGLRTACLAWFVSREAVAGGSAMSRVLNGPDEI